MTDDTEDTLWRETASCGGTDLDSGRLPKQCDCDCDNKLHAVLREINEQQATFFGLRQCTHNRVLQQRQRQERVRFVPV